MMQMAPVHDADDTSYNGGGEMEGGLDCGSSCDGGVGVVWGLVRVRCW